MNHDNNDTTDAATAVSDDMHDQSMKIGVNRTIDDNRYVILLSSTV